MVDYLNASNVVEQRRRAAREAGGQGPRTIVRCCSVLQIVALPYVCLHMWCYVLRVSDCTSHANSHMRCILTVRNA